MLVVGVDLLAQRAGLLARVRGESGEIALFMRVLPHRGGWWGCKGGFTPFDRPEWAWGDSRVRGGGVEASGYLG